MAKVNVEFDTNEKTISVSIDGNVLEDVKSVEFYPSYDRDDEFHCGITQVTIDSEKDMRVVTRLVAHEQEGLQEGPVPGLYIEYVTNKVHEDIQNCFN